MLNPKIIFLVSDWVYNSPIFGKGVRLAGFYPVSQGLEGGVEHLREKVNQGFSLMVFPEGSRSEDNHIKRFHKGAFYLAETFNLDIIPVVIHGNSEVLPKGDFIINDGSITVEIMERITPDDIRFGENYVERTKKINHFFRESFAIMRFQIEGVNYFKKMILHSFAYKEMEIISEVKATLDQKLQFFYNKNEIGKKAKILHISNDYGETDLLLSLQAPERKIYSFIASEEKRDVAKTNYIVKKRAIHHLENLNPALLKQYDVVLISDENYSSIIEEIVTVSSCIILINNSSLKDTLLNFGYTCTNKEDKILVLKKE